MNTFRFVPEGWNEEIEKLDIQKIQEYQQENKTVQGIVQSCDEKYDLHIQLGNDIELLRIAHPFGIMPVRAVLNKNLSDEQKLERGIISRTARRIMEGMVYIDDNNK